MKITNKNFEKKARDIMKLTHDEWYVDELDESKVMKWTEVKWIKNVIDRGYSVTFKKEGATSVNKIWSDEQGAVINKMQKDIVALQTDVAVLKTDVAELKEGMSLILKHLGIKK